LGDKARLGTEERKALHGADYAERFEYAHPIERITRLVPLMSLTGNEKLVDIGCGNALSMTAMKGRYDAYTGVDFSAPFIKAARNRAQSHGILNAEFFCGSAEDFAVDNADRFDVALALDISEHVYDDEWLGILIAIHRMLLPGGRLFLHTPNLEFFVERMKDKNFLLKQFPEHIAVRSMQGNIRLLHDAGFEIRHAQNLPHYNWLSVLHPLSRIPGLGRYFGARLFIEAVKAD
jgi:2-polyprenyl-6-hydroxyphenyl methylase/3-demethylubiquinone-9 3-methyltransferase